MINMQPTIEAKSSQLNADDLIGGPITIKITGVTVISNEQPVAVSYEGDNNKPWKPCKGMCRVMVQVWGVDGEKYVGQSLTLYLDRDVTWGGIAVGGIRISNMSGIDKKVVMALTASRGRKKSFVVEPLSIAPEAATEPPAEVDARLKDNASVLIDSLADCSSLSFLKEFWESRKSPIEELRKLSPDLYKEVVDAKDKKKQDLD